MSEPWPEVVWSSPLLRGLDARGRREVAAAGALLERAPGEALFTEGAPADALFVILEGEVGLSALGRGKAVARIERRMRPGDALGEEALLGPHAVRDGDAVATRRVVAASVPCVVLTRALVRAGGAELEARTSRAVRRRLLERRLAVSGLTAGLGEGPVGELLDMAEHRDVARGEVVFGAGERARALVFVLDGLLSTHEVDDGGKLAPVGYVGRGDLGTTWMFSHGHPRAQLPQPVQSSSRIFTSPRPSRTMAPVGHSFRHAGFLQCWQLFGRNRGDAPLDVGTRSLSPRRVRRGTPSSCAAPQLQTQWPHRTHELGSMTSSEPAICTR